MKLTQEQYEAGEEVNHKNGIKSDCSELNLEYLTHGENVLHAYRKLSRKPRDGKGEKSGRSKLTESDVLEIRRMREKGMTHRAIAESFSVCRAAITQIIIGRNWSHT